MGPVAVGLSRSIGRERLVQQNDDVPLYRYSSASLAPVPRTTFESEQIRERQDLQRLLLNDLSILGDDLLAITEEYGAFKDSSRRIDILALDRRGNLVVIELKRTDDGGHMDLQSLRYAAMVSTMTLDHLVETYAEAHHVEVEQAKLALTDWIEEPLEELPNRVRVILVSADFSTEVTSTVLWLNDNYGTDIACFRLSPYRLGDELLVDLQQLIPLPEATDFQIQQRRKVTATAANRESGRDFTRYDLVLGEESITASSKQGAVKLAIIAAHQAGVDIDSIRTATRGHRWNAVHPQEGESVQDAFVREYPESSPGHRWFDLEIREGDTAWTTPRWGGADTETMLDALARASRGKLRIEWSKNDAGGRA
ncbi:hypothetical protein SAMN06295973_2798 [Plantibacter cousiniae]|uniref:DUF91 domain-containing protein n=1 Tax=Plantibacter cousiniae (nom. nud.) TaxID=199709 RepID=A0ABY1LNE9_9MICO|nr:hypothetical protein SAMN06295973_2798 [Plantibacter cousiniae]